MRDEDGEKNPIEARNRPSGQRSGRYRSLVPAGILALTFALAAVLAWNVIRDRKSLTGTGGGNGAGAATGNAAAALPSPLGTVAGGAPSADSPDTSETVFRKASPSVVVVKMFGGEEQRLRSQGGGVVVAPETVATNRHVVESGGEIRVVVQGREYPAAVLHADREYDLCALSVPGLAAPPAELASVRTVRPGQRVYAIGAPKGLESTISGGLVSAVRPYGEFPLIQTDAPISRGSSGGGLFDTDGRLVGITTASAIDGQNINFALAADLVPLLPLRSADIRTLRPVVPVRTADEIGDKALLDSLAESRRAVAESEGELKGMAEEIERRNAAMTDWKRTMDDCLALKDLRAYNGMVPHYNYLNGERNELVNRFERKRRAHASLVERHNLLVRQCNDRGRLQR